MNIEELCVSNIRWWPGQHYEDGVPIHIAENPEGSTITIREQHYTYSRCENGRKYYVLKKEYRCEE